MGKEDSGKFENKLVTDLTKAVPLRVAASVVHQQLSGSSRTWKDDDYGAILDSTALALSHVSDIYYLSKEDRLLRIPSQELAVGIFEDGAKRFRTRSGNVYEPLSMRRGDMADAIQILRKAHGAVQAAGTAPTGTPKEPT